MQVTTRVNPLAVILLLIFTGPFGLLIAWLLSFEKYPESESCGDLTTGQVK